MVLLLKQTTQVVSTIGLIPSLLAILTLFACYLKKLHCKKESAIFPSQTGMSLTKLSLGGKKLNYSRPGRV
jgi:hypothetical protein